CPTSSCLLISSISFLTCASLTGRKSLASPPRGGPAPGRRVTPPRMGRCSCRQRGDAIVVAHGSVLTYPDGVDRKRAARLGPGIAQLQNDGGEAHDKTRRA